MIGRMESEGSGVSGQGGGKGEGQSQRVPEVLDLKVTIWDLDIT